MSPIRNFLAQGDYYYVFNRSIAGYVIFNNVHEYMRMLALIKYYQFSSLPKRFSHFIENTELTDFDEKFNPLNEGGEKLVRMVGFCLMPTHIHLILNPVLQGGISKFVSNVLNSYARYFNMKHNRKGPLWEGRFKSVRVETQEQLLHLTRYVHLNPTTANLVSAPEDWIYSSCREYLSLPGQKAWCDGRDVVGLSSVDYRKFLEDRIFYQQELARIKKLVLD